MRGGPRFGAGRPKNKKCPDTVRDHVVRVSMTESEYEVLAVLGEQWNLPVATAAYGLLADQIATCRNEDPLAMPEKLIYAASVIVAKHKPEQRRGV